MKRASLAAMLLVAASPVLAVGLGPLTKEGLTDGPNKGFYLTVINPYPRAETFVFNPLAEEEEIPAARVAVIPQRVRVGPGGQRRVLAVAAGLAPGETYTFRVCAERPSQPSEMVHARVCSKLRARRITNS